MITAETIDPPAHALVNSDLFKRSCKRGNRTLAKRKPTKEDIEQRLLISVGVNGPTPERAHQAGDPLVRHKATGEFRRRATGTMEDVDSGAIRVNADILGRLHKRGTLSKSDPDKNLAMLAAGRRLEGIILKAGLTGSVASPNLMGNGGVAPGSSPYVRSISILDARDELNEIRRAMVRRDWEAVKWCIVTGFTVEQGGKMLGGDRRGEAVYLDRLRGGLEWLVDRWGMMTGRASRIRSIRA